MLLYWHRRKLPFEIPDFAKFCHKKNRKNFFFVPGGLEYYIDLKMHTKSQSGAYQKENDKKNPSILQQNKAKRGTKI